MIKKSLSLLSLLIISATASLNAALFTAYNNTGQTIAITCTTNKKESTYPIKLGAGQKKTFNTGLRSYSTLTWKQMDQKSYTIDIASPKTMLNGALYIGPNGNYKKNFRSNGSGTNFSSSEWATENEKAQQQKDEKAYNEKAKNLADKYNIDY